MGPPGFLVYQLLVDSPDSVVSAVGLVLTTSAAAACIAATTSAIVRGKPFASVEGMKERTLVEVCLCCGARKVAHSLKSVRAEQSWPGHSVS